MGFIAAVREWFSAENISRRQAWVKTRHEALQKKGFKHLSGSAWKWIRRILWGTVLAILLGWVLVSAIEDNALAIVLALPAITLIGVRRFWPPAGWLAAGLLTLYGLAGLAAFGLNWLGSDVHIVALYGAVVLVSFFGAVLIDSKAVIAVVACVVVAAVLTLVVGIVGGIIDTFDSFPTSLVVHLLWGILGLVAVVLAFLFARPQAALLVLVMLSAAGFHEFVWAYNGIRRQDVDVWGIVTVIPDQAFYGFLFLLVALAVVVARPFVESEEEDDTEEMPKPEFDEETRDLLNQFYELDKQKRIFAGDWSRFLAWVLNRFRVTPEELEARGVTVETYVRYSAQRAIEEIRAAHNASKTVIIRKDGTVNPKKLSELGFRKGFLDDHEITGEEMLTGEVSEFG